MNRRQFVKTGLASAASAGVSRFVPASESAETSAPAVPSVPVKATLNGLDLIFDSETGSLLQMAYPGPGRMLETFPARAGLVDLAYPLPEFEALRLASRFSRGAKVQASNKGVVIRIENLGASRDVKLAGRVSATVRLAAHPDGRSIIMTCEIDNQSNKPVRQVVFPDLFGVVPFAGEESTVFRTAGFGMQPFKELKPPEHGSRWYALTATQKEYMSGAPYGEPYDINKMVLRWMDLGSLKGGFSLFQKRWLWDPEEDPEWEMHREHVLLQLSEVDNRLRLMCLHKVGITVGQQWKSKEYVLTPHAYGWAEGIEPFRQWVKQNWKREHPVPKHVQEGLGFRTIWGSQPGYTSPVARCGIYKFTDLPTVAKEAKEHGLDEICFWHWFMTFQSPIPGPFTVVGTEEEMAANTAVCKRMGVNVGYFITCMLLASPSAQSYGLVPSKRGPNMNYTYNTDSLPRLGPEYMVARWAAAIEQNNRRWQADMLRSCKHLADVGCASIDWDMFGGDASVHPNLYTLNSQIRDYARQRDPQSTFAGESITEVERDSIYLDYTWNWINYQDYRPYTSVMAAPRLNPNIDRSARDVKLCFMDNLYMNIQPSKPDGVNGSAMITEYPEMSRTLKQCASLRKRFLADFLEGKLIGECLLTDPCSGSHVTAYVRSGRALMIFMNMDEERPEPQSFKFSCDLSHWVPSSSGYEINSFDIDGKLLQRRRVQSAIWQSETGALEKHGLILYEIIAG